PDLFTMVGRYEVPPDQAVSQSPAQASVESDDTESVSASTAMFNVAAPVLRAGVQPADKVAALLDSLEARRGLSDRDASDDPIALIREGLGARQRPSATSPLTGLEGRLDSQPGLEEQLNLAFETSSREGLIAAIGRISTEEATRRIDDISIQLVIQSDSADNAGGAGPGSQAQAAAFSIEAFIQTEGFTCHPIPGDGHCMFASIAHAAGGELRDAVEADSLEAAMAIRQWVMEKLVDLEPDRIANLATRPEARSAKLGESYLELARGFNVAQPDQDGWGTPYSLPVAAALFDRPIVVIDQNGIGNLYQPDCSEESLNNGQRLPEGDFKLLVQKLREKGQKPIAIYKSGPAHFQSVNLEP
ncbi:MAG: OTU domain-containing protein, partial [Betaproteobacteria bacterium]